MCWQGQKALQLFRKIQREGLEPSPVNFVGVLNACASIVALEEGRCTHEQIIHSSFESDIFVGNSICAKCGNMGDAWRMFNEMPSRNVVSFG